MRLRLDLACAVALTAAAAACLAGEPPAASLREALLAVPVTADLGGATTRPIASDKSFQLQAPNAARSHQRPFSFGNRLFNTNWTIAPGSVKSFDGLGPVFNRVSCSGCHTRDGRGSPPASGEGPLDSMLIRLSVPGTDAHGGPNPHPAYGDQLNERAIPGVPAEGRTRITYEEIAGQYGDGESYSLRKPRYEISGPAFGPLGADVMLSPRVAPHMIGLGLLEAVPDETLQALADPADADGDGISGRINTLWDAAREAEAIGRFGWKAGQPTLLLQSAGAALGDIGLTTSLHRAGNCTAAQSACAAASFGEGPEISDEFLGKLTLYTQSIAVPAQRGAGEPRIAKGEKIFRNFGCAACHVPTLKTSASAALPELGNQTFHPFTDLLLHDMGEGLADGRPEFTATGAEWRTPPLWGLGLVQTVNGHDNLLHDGRARGFAEAILWHGGEAEAAKENFRLAPKDEREALAAFLKSL